MNIKRFYRHFLESNNTELPQIRDDFETTIPVYVEMETKTTSPDKYQDGITVVTATYNGEKYITRLLESINKQKLSPERFEHIIVINGERDSTPHIVKGFMARHPQLDIKILYSDIANASNARNLGIDEAKYAYITFVDDDDYLSPKYLQEMYKNRAPNRIVIASFLDEDEETGVISESYFSHELLKNSRLVKEPYRKLVGALTISVCKLIPTHFLEKTKFSTDLNSGIDVAFYSELYSRNLFEFYVINQRKGAIYYRVARQNSMSKRPLSYNFNVTQRLNVICNLNQSIKRAEDPSIREFIKGKVRAQTIPIKRYLEQHPKDAPQICEDISKLELEYFPYNEMNKNLARRLIISFNFPPYVTASGNTVAKRISEKGEIVDVLCNEMARDTDENLNKLADEFIDRKMVLNTIPTFGSWPNIKSFCQKGMDKIEKITEIKGEYESIYSRSMFPASHFLAFQYKIKHPEVKWSAEFSDPVLYDSNGRMRKAPINDPEYFHHINDLIADLGYQLPVDDNLFFLCEYLPYLFADELIFTNENQEKYMVEKFPLNQVKSLVKSKAKIETHPIPRERFYNLQECEYHLDRDYVNLAYFGAFYETRNMNDIFFAMYSLNKAYRDRCRIHFFTSDVKYFQDLIDCIPIKDNLIVHPYVSFLEFLNLSTKFDCLIVNDTVSGVGEINPFLPSKLSDYLGGGKDVWILYENGSAMSRYDVKYRSQLNNSKSTSLTLERIIRDHLPTDISDETLKKKLD
ncbi:MAG: glycosyltransferase [Methanobacterium sp.]|nr:glycosyltransferase [Methanobacterium sp.]